MAAGAVSLRKSHDIVILSFCNIVKGQAIYLLGKFIPNLFFSKSTINKCLHLRVVLILLRNEILMPSKIFCFDRLMCSHNTNVYHATQ